MKKSKKSNSHINKYLALLSGVFQYAILKDIVKFNPMSKVDFLKVRKVNFNRIHVFTDTEMMMLERACSPEFLPIFMFAKYTGARKGEIIGLPWECVDFEDDKLTIVYNSVDKVITTLKGDNEREIKMHRNLKIALLDWQDITPKSRWVFCSTHPNFLGELRDNFSRSWWTAKRRANVKGRFHDIRHTFATKLANTSGVTPAQIQYIMGWRSAKMLEVYQHIEFENTKNAIDRLEY